jgi:beta-glucuronidase
MSLLFVRRLVPLALTAIAVLALAVPPAGAATPPPPVLLDEGWEFQSRAGGPWQKVAVPHVFDASASAATFEGQVSTYRLRFQAPATPAGFDWALRFESVRRRAKVTLNGRPIGRNSDPYTPFQLTAAGLRPGQNELVVRVDNRRTPGYREGWWNWGGITRRVHLVPLGRLSMRGVGLLSQVDCSGVCRASVRADGWITNRSTVPQRPLVAVQLREPGGGPTSQRTVRMRTVAPGETARLQVDVPIAGSPKLWAPENPQLYSATVQARIGSQVEQTQSDEVGLRTVTVRRGRLLLNGRQLELRGASIQEDIPGRGPAMTDADIAEIVSELKAVHANVTRAHYLLDERLLDAFDRAGILVWSQSPVYHRDVQLRDTVQRNRELGSVRRTVLEARKHPSVITHSVANELSPQPDETFTTRDFLYRAARITRDLDPTVPASVDILAWPGFPRQRAFANFDLLGVNSYFGWYRGDEEHPTASLSDLEPYLEDLHAKYPAQAVVMTEFGAESTMDGPANVKETYAFQADYLRHYLGVLERHRWMSGALYWTLREFAVKPEWDGGAERDVPRDSIHNKGLISYADGRRKPAWSVARTDFASTPMYRTSAPRAVAAAVGAQPETPSPSVATVAITGGVLTLLAFAAALLAWLMRDVLRFGDRPPPRRHREAERRERRLRAVA